MFGVRIGLGSSRRVGINISAGFSDEGWKVEGYNEDYTDDYFGASLRIGIDF